MTRKHPLARLPFKRKKRLVSYATALMLVGIHALWHYYSLQLLSTTIKSEEKYGSLSNTSKHLDTQQVTPRRSSETNVHTKDTQIPPWMEHYFQWHAVEMAQLNASNYMNQKYLLLRCLNMDNKCGGASDRLQTIPALVLAAYRTKRLLLIKWERPHPLEEFLVPPQGDGLNWTVPTWLDQQFTYQPRLEIVNEVHLRHAEQSTKWLIQTRFQAADYGADYYNTYRPDGPLFDEVFHDCWERLFEPSAAVAARVIETTANLGLFPGQYTAVHIRSKYIAEKTERRGLIQNAVKCASQLRNSHEEPIYVAADDHRAIGYAMAYGASKGGLVVGQMGEQPILHLDRGADFLSMNSTIQPDIVFPPSAYYETFVDFYMLAFSRCLALHKGGFARWAKRMMQNSSCVVNHGKDACTWISD